MALSSRLNKNLAQQLFVGLDGNRVAAGLDPEFLLLDVVSQGAHDFVDGGVQRDFRAADFARTRVIDEFIQLGGDLVGFVHDGARFFADVLRRRAGLFGKHLRHAADDVERIAGFVREAGGGQVHFPEVRIQFAGADEADLQFRRFGKVAPGQPGADGGNGGQKDDDGRAATGPGG